MQGASSTSTSLARGADLESRICALSRSLCWWSVEVHPLEQRHGICFNENYEETTFWYTFFKNKPSFPMTNPHQKSLQPSDLVHFGAIELQATLIIEDDMSWWVFSLIVWGYKALVQYQDVYTVNTHISRNWFRSSLPGSNHPVIDSQLFSVKFRDIFYTSHNIIYNMTMSSQGLLRPRTFLQHVCVKRSYS